MFTLCNKKWKSPKAARPNKWNSNWQNNNFLTINKFRLNWQKHALSAKHICQWIVIYRIKYPVVDITATIQTRNCCYSWIVSQKGRSFESRRFRLVKIKIVLSLARISLSIQVNCFLINECWSSTELLLCHEITADKLRCNTTLNQKIEPPDSNYVEIALDRQMSRPGVCCIQGYAASLLVAASPETVCRCVDA